LGGHPTARKKEVYITKKSKKRFNWEIKQEPDEPFKTKEQGRRHLLEQDG